jgi:tetratricopeptide (TPR) repeat protein
MSAVEDEGAEFLEDDELLAQLGVASPVDEDITQLRHVRPRAEINAADEVAQRKTCADFDRFKPLEVKLGQTNGAIKDFATLRSMAGQNAVELNSLCWMQATLGVALEAALADCEASLKIRPQLAATLDSKGFVLLRLGRFEQSIQTYDEAVRIRPGQAPSLYGRGLAKLKLGLSSEAEADLVAARARMKSVDEEFAGYGLKPGA